MKLSTIALAAFFALGSTLAVAQGAGGAGGAGAGAGGAGAGAGGGNGPAMGNGQGAGSMHRGKSMHMTTGMAGKKHMTTHKKHRMHHQM
jgi:hypothetical protein